MRTCERAAEWRPERIRHTAVCSPPVIEHREREESHNYILERQESYQVQGVPTDRLIIGKREIDVYSNGQMFEGDHMVGIQSR
jgi:hypothetical protein